MVDNDGRETGDQGIGGAGSTGADVEILDAEVVDAATVAADAAVEVADVLPPQRQTIATHYGRTFDAHGSTQSERWRPGGAAPVEVRGQVGCVPGLLRWAGYAVGGLLLALAAVALLGGSGVSGGDAVSWLRDSGATGRLALVVFVALVTPFFVPSGLMAVVPGYLWGTVEGTALILIGAALGGVLNMWLARRVFDKRIGAVIDAAPMLGVLRETIRARGFRIALGLRMSPVTPYSMLAYLAGVAGLSYGRFTLASVLGGIPWTSVYAMAGALLASTAQELRLGETPDLGPETAWLRWVGLAFTVAVAVWIGRAARADLAKVRSETNGLR